VSVKISALPDSPVISDDDVFPLVDDGVTRKATIGELRSALDAGAPTDRVSIRDDLHDLDAWVISTQDGGEAEHGATATAAGFRSSGALKLSCSTSAGSEASAGRAQTAIVPDAAVPAVVEWRIGALPADECQWIAGMLAGSDRLVGILVDWDGVAMVASDRKSVV
jgi:hypothetical protein